MSSYGRPVCFALLLGSMLFGGGSSVRAQDGTYEEAVVDVGNVGLTITNAGFIGRANVRNNPAGPPSFEYPLDSGVEHLFEGGLWVGAVRSSDRSVRVRTGAVTTSGGYTPGLAGYEFTSAGPIIERSTLPESDVFSARAVSHQDFTTTFVDTATTLPGTFIPHPDPAGRLGLSVTLRTHAYNFPFAEHFVVLNFDIVNVGRDTLTDVYVGLYHNLVARNVNTSLDQGSQFFNKGGQGFIDSLNALYAFNAGGQEETINTYAAVAYLGGEWIDPQTGQPRYFHPDLAEQYVQQGYQPPRVNPRWWAFGSNPDPLLSRPSDDAEMYRRMSLPYPDPAAFRTPDGGFDQAAYEAARAAWLERLRTGGVVSDGNWLGLTSVGPFPRLEPGDTVTATFAMVAALKPPEFQGQSGKAVDTPESRAILRENIRWAQRTYAGEDRNNNGVLDPGEDINANGVLDRYLIPEPPASPRMRVVLSGGRVELFWDRSAEGSVDPVTGLRDFEGYRVYRSNPGDDRTGNILDRATLVAQYDEPGNRSGLNNGFDEIRLAEPRVFEGDTTQYWYRFAAENLSSGWQYLFTVSAFDEGDAAAGLPSFESSRTANAVRVFPGTPPAAPGGDLKVGVYPNPYRAGAAWDGGTARNRRLNFYNLPARCEIRIYTLAGETVAEMQHDAATYAGDIRWYEEFGGEERLLPGGEHSWDLLSESGLNLSTGLYLFSVRDLETDEVQTGKFAIIK